MKLNVDLSLLLSAVEKMGATGIDVIYRPVVLEDIDIQLREHKIEISFDEIDFESGLASYQGRQVLLYIKDHSFKDNIVRALANGADGHRFHVADCQTLKGMRQKKRFDRYVVTNSLNGTFPIAGTNAFTKQFHSGETDLKVCKYCLTYLNYQGYGTGGVKSQIFSNFIIADFFDTYSSFFPHKPSGIANIKSVTYTPDWDSISANYKKKRNYVCECCNVNMANAKHLFHVHHKNGVKGDNSQSNLMALCADCHKKQPDHEHMFILRKDVMEIARLRREQLKSMINSWDDVYKFADPALHGLIRLLKSENVSLPSVGEVLSPDVPDLIADLIWRKRKFAISIDSSQSQKAKSFGWRVYSMAECLNKSLEGSFSTITSKL